MLMHVILVLVLYERLQTCGAMIVKPNSDVDQEALILCSEIHPSPRWVAFAYYTNNGCSLTCVLSNGILTEDHVSLANNGTQCGRNGVCDKIGGCSESPLKPYGDPAEAWSWCKRVHRSPKKQLTPIELDGGCEIMCRRLDSNHTIYRNNHQSCGPDMVCVDGACVLDERMLSSKIDWLLDGINGSILCRKMSNYYRSGDLRNFGCQLKCIPAFGWPMIYNQNEGENCHYAGKCQQGLCTNATQITKVNYAKVNRTRFKNELMDLLLGEYVDTAFLDRNNNKFNAWRTRSLDRVLPYLRPSLREIKENVRSGLPFDHLSGSTLRTRVNFLMEGQLSYTPFTAEENFFSHKQNARWAFRRPAVRPRACRVKGIDARMLEKTRNLPGQLMETQGLAVKYLARYLFKVPFPGTGTTNDK